MSRPKRATSLDLPALAVACQLWTVSFLSKLSAARRLLFASLFSFPPQLSLLDQDQLRRPMAHAITKDPNILGGEPVFRGTRVPFKILIDYLQGGDTLDQFLEQYPTVSRELAIAAIEEARVSLLSQLR